MNLLNLQDRAQGCLLGLAVGDAVGTTVEFKDRGTFTPLTDMVGGGPFNLPAGDWTDDTSMALCLADSLINTGFDPKNQMDQYVDWYLNGHMSTTGRCFDIGGTTRSALERYRRDPEKNPFAGSTHFLDAGNGCIMRLAPVPIRYSNNPELARELSGTQSSTTHGSDECVEASSMFGEILVRALNGETYKAKLVILEENGLRSPNLDAIARGDYLTKSVTDIKGSGYVVESLEAALWCFMSTDNFRDCILAAANLGDDADTTAAVAGQLAGAYYGLTGIPDTWVKRVAWGTQIISMADQLLEAQNELNHD